MRRDVVRRAWFSGLMLAAALTLTLAPYAAQDAPPPPAAPPAPGQAPAPDQPAPPPAAPAAPVPALPAPAAPAPTPEPPRIIRVVCTDHICGHCDGKCHKGSGHVAVDKKGHCACTPEEGSPLDRATRQAYEKSQPR